MYQINGVALDNEARGWALLSPTKPLSEYVRDVVSLRIPGRDGFAPVRGSMGSPVLPFVIETPNGASYEQLLALLMKPNGTLRLAAAPTREIGFEFLSDTYAGYGDADAVLEITALLRLNTVWWRDITAVTNSPTAIASASQVVNVLDGLSAPVRDAIIRVAGSITGVKVADSQGAWVRYPQALPAGSYLRFHADTGRAFVTTTDTWTGGTEVTGQIENGPGPYLFEATPYFTTDPGARVARLTVTSDARAGSPTIEVRGKRAYVA